jgi:predicted acylesterase/phospholipase RssA
VDWVANRTCEEASSPFVRLVRTWSTQIFFPAIIIAFTEGCTILPRLPAVPADSTQLATISSISGARYWPNIDTAPMEQSGNESVHREMSTLERPINQLPIAYYLAISGGGDSGAFGAGLLVGWTDSGTRPEFKVVTGISAGALIAPFAFLGPQYDSVLRTVSLSLDSGDLFHRRGWLHALTGDAFADNTPLARVVARYIDQPLMAAVAKEYAKGRLLLIGTTDLDANQTVVWNMGEIASSNDLRSLKLFRQVILASTSIPGVFPPVMIDVEVSGHRYQEMHVDGGVINQVFLFPMSLMQDLKLQRSFDTRERQVFLIRNSRIDPHWQPVARHSTEVALRALDALIEEQGINDIYRLQVTAQEHGEHLHIAYIEQSFSYPHAKAFAHDYMSHLFEYSYRLAVDGYPWHDKLPN